MMKTDTRRLLLGVSGGIAAYKAPLLIRQLAKHNVEVKVVLTKAARTLVGEDTLRTLSGNPVFIDGSAPANDMDHIRLAQWADLYVICPATANTIAKIAGGIADNLLTTLALSFNGTLMIAPAMNMVMWQNPATVDNIALLKKRGIRILPVAHGSLACGDEGPGRMVSIETILEFILGADVPRCFAGKKIVIASGATAEPLDPVRVITNRSSGRMGAACANAALCMGAEVVVISGYSKVPLPEGICLKRVNTAQEMAEALTKHFASCDVCIMAAAISDFRPASVSNEKMKRPDTGSLSLELVANQDIAALCAQQKKTQFLVCFSLETDGGTQRAEEKMLAKGCDMMVYNTVNSSLGGERAEIGILHPGQAPLHYGPMDKRACGREILLSIAKRLDLYNE